MGDELIPGKIAGYPAAIAVPVVVVGAIIGIVIVKKFSGSSSKPEPTIVNRELQVGARDEGNTVPRVEPHTGPALPVQPPKTGQAIPMPVPDKNPAQLPKKVQPVLPPQTVPPAHIVQPVPPIAPQRPVPQPTPTPHRENYPGLPSGFQMDCANTAKVLLGTWEQVLAGQVAKGGDAGRGVFLARNMTTVAITGATTPWRYNPLAAASSVNRIFVNQTRVKWGLFPLTDAEFDALRLDALNIIGVPANPSHDYNGVFSEHQAYFTSLRLAKMIFDKYNYPYQCGRHALR